ncbi:MAG: MalY/PatB family protein [Granulosicoccus sp.]
MIDFDNVIPRNGTDSLKWDKYKGTEVLPFWVADMDFEVAEPIQSALATRLQHPVFGYSVAPADLTDAVTEHLRRFYDWQVEPDWIVWLPGVVPGLAVSCRAFCPDDHQVVVNPPIYHHFYDAHELDRQEIVRVPLKRSENRWTYDMPAMEAAFGDKTRLMMMCSPHNPTGTVFKADELQAVASLCRKHDVIMVSDEIHCDLVFDPAARHIPTAVACPDMADRIITLMSGSKTWNIAGLNCSFAIISNAELRKQFKTSCQSIVSMVPPLAYEATRAAYERGDAWRQELLKYLAANYAWLRENLNELPGVNVEPIQATYLAWIDCTGLGLDNTQAFFERHGVGLSSGEQFGQPGYVRLNFACPRATLAEGVRRMQNAIRELQASS